MSKYRILPGKIVRKYHDTILVSVMAYAASVWANRQIENRRLAISMNSVQKEDVRGV